MKTTIHLTVDDYLTALAAEDIDLKVELDKRAGDCAKELGVAKEKVLEAWNHPSVRNGAKAMVHLGKIGGKAFFSTTSMAAKTMEKGFEQLHKTKAGQNLHKGAVKADEFLDKHPKLKAATGIALAGLMYKGWTLMTFMGDLDYDFDYTGMAELASGDKGIADFISSPSGLMYATLLATGAGLGLGFGWMGGTAANTALGLTYTAAKHLKNKTGAELLDKLEKNAFIKPFVANGRKVAAEAQKQYGPALKDLASKLKSKTPKWWDKLSKKRQEAYVEQHPETELEVTASVAIQAYTRPELVGRQLRTLMDNNGLVQDEWNAMLLYNRKGQKSWAYMFDGNVLIGAAILEYKHNMLGTVGVLVDRNHRGQGYAKGLLKSLKVEVLRNHQKGVVETPSHVAGLVRSVFGPEFEVLAY